MKNAILVGIKTKDDIYDISYTLDELYNLVTGLDIEVKGVVKQQIDKPNPKTFVGKGKVDEIKMEATVKDCDTVIFDTELTPAQIRNLSTELNLEICDRAYIILEIFNARASTQEAMLEIKLAKDRYLLPRLSMMNIGLSRQGGASGATSSKGAGEKQSELTRRYLANEIIQIEKELAKIRVMKQNQIEKRKKNEVPIVALVGYTNAGKSSTMNTILNMVSPSCDKQVYAKDELFATLSTFNRSVVYKKQKFILVDTIGFVSKLPTFLINSFRQTLEEIKNADLIIHVVDISSKYFQQQVHVTNSIIESLGCRDIPMLYLLNKYDKYSDEQTQIVGVENLPFSNKSDLNHEELLNYIVDKIKPRCFDAKIIIPYKDGALINFVEENATIYEKNYLEQGVYFNLEIDMKYYSKIALYEINDYIS